MSTSMLHNIVIVNFDFLNTSLTLPFRLQNGEVVPIPGRPKKYS